MQPPPASLDIIDLDLDYATFLVLDDVRSLYTKRTTFVWCLSSTAISDSRFLTVARAGTVHSRGEQRSKTKAQRPWIPRRERLRNNTGGFPSNTNTTTIGSGEKRVPPLLYYILPP